MSKTPKGMSRREWLQISGLTMGNLVVNACSTPPKKKKEAVFSIDDKKQVFKQTVKSEDDGPIDRSLSEQPPFHFIEEDPDHSHQILWDPDRFLKTMGGVIPPPQERADVVVIGGGISGLVAAYQLRKFSPVVLESGNRFGGNARGESWRGAEYSLFSQKLSKPVPGSVLESFLKDIDAFRPFKDLTPNSPYFLSKAGVPLHNILSDGGDILAQAQIKSLIQYLEGSNDPNSEKFIPSLPPKSDQESQVLKVLDNVALSAQLRKVLNIKSMAPLFESWLEHYCWVYFGASSSEVSSAVALNHMKLNLGSSVAANGGNAILTEQIYKKLRRSVSSENLRSRAVVFRVKKEGNEMWVTFERDGKINTIAATSIVFACPKFVLPKIYKDLTPEKSMAIRRMEYRSCLVGVAQLQSKSPTAFYEADIQKAAKTIYKTSQEASDQDQSVHCFNSTFSNTDAKFGLLNLIRPLPHLFGRANIYNTGAFLKFRKEMIQQLENEILPSMKVPSGSILGFRLTRGGHVIPVPGLGKISSGDLETIQKPIDQRVFFINQDNWLMPRFEVLFQECLKWTEDLSKNLEELKKMAVPVAPEKSAKSAPPPPSKK